MSEENAVREAIVVAFERVDWEELGRQLAYALHGFVDVINDITDKMLDYLDVIEQDIELRKEQGEKRQSIFRKKRPLRCIGAPCVVYLKRARPCCRSNC